MFSHESVLLKESVEWLAPGPSKVIVDGTVGAGGHSKAILEAMGAGGKLVGFDRDPEALILAGKNLESFKDKVMLIHENYRNMSGRLTEERIAPVDGILLDLGVSSMQLDEDRRGFSFLKDGPLDMRMNPEDSLTAAKVVNEASEKTLLEILWKYGEERFARRIVRSILFERKKGAITTTRELAIIVENAVPAYYRFGRVHPATRTFQALRMAVNGELQSLDEFLATALDVLKENGRVAVISFHSLEDRKVKQTFREWQTKELGKVLTKKPVTPSEEEAARNPRARSAKLRVFEKRAL